MKNSVRTPNRIMRELVSGQKKKARVGKRGANILRTLSRSAIQTYFGLSYWDSVPADLVSDTSHKDDLKDIRLVYFYPDDFCRETGISQDTLRRDLKELDGCGFIHFFSPLRDDNNYVIYCVGLDSVPDPSTPEGAGGYITTDRAFYDAIKEIKEVARLRIYIRLYQENARTNHGRDLFESKSVKSLLTGLPIYTTRPAFLAKLSGEEGAGGELCSSGISFRKKNRRRYDIEMTGCYSYKQRQESREDNINRLIEDSRKLGKLGRWLMGNLTGVPDGPDGILSDPGRAMLEQAEARKTYEELFGEQLSDEKLYGIYGLKNPYSLSTFETVTKFLDPSGDCFIANSEYRSLADEYGAGRCFDTLKKIWNGFLNGTIKNLSADKSCGKKETNLLALIKKNIWNELSIQKCLFGKALKTCGDEKITFTPTFPKMYAI